MRRGWCGVKGKENEKDWGLYMRDGRMMGMSTFVVRFDTTVTFSSCCFFSFSLYLFMSIRTLHACMSSYVQI
jgi:hypothetical protein